MQSRRHAGKSPAAVAMRYAAAEWPFDCSAPASGGTEGWSGVPVARHPVSKGERRAAVEIGDTELRAQFSADQGPAD